MLEVTADVQQEIANSVGATVELELHIAPFPGAGVFSEDVAHTVLESAGYAVELTNRVTQVGDALRIVGTVRRGDQA